MADDDPQLGEPEELFAPPGPRRSTYTPPAHTEATMRNAAKVFSDEEIAAALAESMPTLGRRAAGVPPTAVPAADPAAAPVAETPVPVAESAPVAETPVPVAESTPVVESAPVAESTPVVETPAAAAEPVVTAPPVAASYVPPVVPVVRDASLVDPFVPREPAATAVTSDASETPVPAAFSFGAAIPAPPFEAPVASHAAESTVEPAVTPESAPAAEAPVEPESAFDPLAYLSAPAPTAPRADAPPPPGYADERYSDTASTAPASTTPEPIASAPVGLEPEAVDQPVAEEAAATADQVPVAEEAPVAAEQSPVVEAAPVAEETPVAAEETPAGEEAPAADASPELPPHRESLADDELYQALQEDAENAAGTLGLIEQLESQMRLREREAREFTQWESSMIELGTPDALAAVEETRGEFTGVIPVISAAEAAKYAEDQRAAAAATADQPEQPEPAEAPVEPESAPEPAEVPVEPKAPAEPEAPAAPPAPAEPDAPPAPEPAAPTPEPSPAPEFEPAPETTPEFQPTPDPVPEFLPAPETSPEFAPIVPSAPEFTPAPSTTPEFSPPGITGDASPQDSDDEVRPYSAAQLAAALGFPPPPATAEFPVQPFADVPPPPGAEATDAPFPLSPDPASAVGADTSPAAETNPAADTPADGGTSAPRDGAPGPVTLEFNALLAGTDEAPAAVESAPPAWLIAAPEQFAPPGDVNVATTTGAIDLAAAVDRSIADLPASAATPPVEPVAPAQGDSGISEADGAPAASAQPDGAVPVAAEPADVAAAAGQADEYPATLPVAPPAESSPDGTDIVGSTDSADGTGSTDLGEPLVAGEPLLGEASAGPDTASTESSAETSAEPTSEFASDATGEATGSAATAVVAPVAAPSRRRAATPARPSAFLAEESGTEPTVRDQRVGKAARLFWLWFAANASLVSVAFGGVIFSLGMSLRQSIVATLAGVALSFLPLGLGTLAGKRSGQPTMVVSRAAFGLVGNILPAVISLVSRLFWGAALLWVLGTGTASILVGADMSGGLSDAQLTLMLMAIGFLIALLIAYFGYALFARIQLILSILSAVLIVGFIALTAKYVNVREALTVPDGPWLLVITGAVLVFSFVGLVWANSTSDLARYQRPSTSSGASMLTATFGSALPSFLLIAYGALLAASNADLAANLAAQPLDALGRLLPVWYPIPLIAATALSLLSGVVITLYSAGFALQAVGARVSRPMAVVLAGVALAAIAAVVTYTATDFATLLRDLATTLAVPVAAWAGIFAADTMIRNRRFDTRALQVRGGRYADFRWTNLSMLIVATVVGLGFTSATISWLGWQGYFFTALDVPLTGTLAGTDIGVIVALLLGLLTPIVAGIPAVRRQESTTVRAE